MENITSAQIRDFAVVLAAILGAIALFGNALKAWKEMKKPHDDFSAWRRGVDEKLANDNARLKSMEDGNKVVCRGILALLSHEINGNSDEKLRESQQEITNYLIDR